MSSQKYNRTYHVPWSPGATSDDKIAESVNSLINVPIIITEKVDGSNTSLEADGCYARTHSGPPIHKSFDGLKSLHSTIKHEITTDTQLFGEWCYALHSIPYNNLPGYFLLFGVRYLDLIEPFWASWEEVEMWAEEIGVPTVPILWQGTVSSQKELQELTHDLANQPSNLGFEREGVVIRIASSFLDKDFNFNILKWVRRNHVKTSKHWKEQEIIRNKLSKNIGNLT